MSEIIITISLSDLQNVAIESVYEQRIEAGETVQVLIENVAKTAASDFINSAVRVFKSREMETINSKLSQIEDAEKLARIEAAIDLELKERELGGKVKGIKYGNII